MISLIVVAKKTLKQQGLQLGATGIWLRNSCPPAFSLATAFKALSSHMSDHQVTGKATRKGITWLFPSVTQQLITDETKIQ